MKRGSVCLLCCPRLAHLALIAPCLAYLIADLADSLSVIVSFMEPILHQRKHRANPAIVNEQERLCLAYAPLALPGVVRQL